MKTIERLRQLLAKATPGPWVYKSQSSGHIAANNEDGLTFFSIACNVGHENAYLVSESHNALPALLAVVEAADAMHNAGVDPRNAAAGKALGELALALRALEGGA